METTVQKPIRILPGIIIVVLQWFLWLVLPYLMPGDTTSVVGPLGGVLCGLAVVVWWSFFSRAPKSERIVAVLMIVTTFIVVPFFLDVSIATAMMGMMFAFYAAPTISFAFVVWAVVSRVFSVRMRFFSMAVAILLGSGIWLFIRTDGMTGLGKSDLKWRWAVTAEDKLLSQAEVNVEAFRKGMENGTAWPGFRGLNRNSVINGTSIETDWTQYSPKEMWRSTVGPGCSSFAVQGSLLYTQEQRGEEERVSCYDLLSGKLLWKHNDKARFYDSHAGAGPRSTPTLADNRVYTLGGTGILNALDALNGKVIWSQNAASDAKVKVLTWGFSSSPLVYKDLVFVALTGKLAAYDISNGKTKWIGPDSGKSYSSPHLVTINNIPQILLMSDFGVLSFDPASGKQLWSYEWKSQDRILQPAIIGDGDFLLVNEANGVRRVTVSHLEGNWIVKEVWTSKELKANFNDLIIHNGYVYGFDGPALSCMGLNDGKRRWKGDRFQGWLLLLKDQDLLIVLSEKGEVALVEAKPEKYSKLAQFQAIKGKTWNHPVLANDILVVRNALEMAAFKLKLKQ